MGSSLKTADTNLGTGCRISHLVTQLNYHVLALCYNTRTELSHPGRDVCHGQVFPHPCVKLSCLAPSASNLCMPGRCAPCRGSVRRAGAVCRWCCLQAACAAGPACASSVLGRGGSWAGVPGVPELLGKLGAESVRPSALRSPRGRQQRACRPQSHIHGVQETLVSLWGIFLVISFSQLFVIAHANYANICTGCWSVSSRALFLLCPMAFTVACFWWWALILGCLSMGKKVRKSTEHMG